MQWPELRALRGARYRGSVFDPRVIFVTVGTQAYQFDRLLRGARRAPGRRGARRPGRALQCSPGSARRASDFLEYPSLLEHIRQARVVVSHAGIGSVITVLAENKRPIVVPAAAALRRGGGRPSGRDRPPARRRRAGVARRGSGPARGRARGDSGRPRNGRRGRRRSTSADLARLPTRNSRDHVAAARPRAGSRARRRPGRAPRSSLRILGRPLVEQRGLDRLGQQPPLELGGDRLAEQVEHGRRDVGDPAPTAPRPRGASGPASTKMPVRPVAARVDLRRGARGSRSRPRCVGVRSVRLPLPSQA